MGSYSHVHNNSPVACYDFHNGMWAIVISSGNGVNHTNKFDLHCTSNLFVWFTVDCIEPHQNIFYLTQN